MRRARRRVRPTTIEANSAEQRLMMMRRTKAMTISERIDLFEAMSRDARWARGARRIR